MLPRNTKMAERITDTLPSVEQGRKKLSFVLQATKRYVGPKYGRETKQFPHFRVPLNAGEERIIGNFSLTVESCCSKSMTAELVVEQICDNPQDITIKDVYQKGNVLKIEGIAEIVLRRFRIDGRPVFHMSVARNISVRSRERMQDSTPFNNPLVA